MKSVFVDRLNTTLLDLIKEPMYIENRACWLNHLDAALEKYNNVHHAIRMTPFEANDKLIPNVKPSDNHNDNNFLKFQVGDFVRVPDKRNIYSKDTSWNGEFLKLDEINNTNLVTYGLEDQDEELSEGKFYEQELLGSVFNFESNHKTLESMSIFQMFSKR